MRRVLITGSRNHTDGSLIWEALDQELAEHGAPITVIHGDARGADEAANAYAFSTPGVYLEVYPADWSLGKVAGHIRNQKMVDAGADICLAFPLPGSRGTWDCIRRAEKAGIPVKIIQENKCDG